MPSRPLSPGLPRPSFLNKTRVLFLVLIISSSAVILFSVVYFLYHLWNSLSNRARTIPFDSSAPLKLQRFCYKDLKNATNDFDDANIIGKGGSGTVFRGIVGDGKLLAIKRLDTLSLQTEREFQNELQILGGLRSPFLVTLLGYCVEKNKRLLVYEYMPNESLQESLFGDGHLSMNWQTRFDVILDVAKALEFLHFGCDPPVIHGDIKPSNVLLDSDYRAKISDFGLSRIKVEGEFGVDLFCQDLGRSQELSGTLGGTTGEHTPAIGTPMGSNNTEVDFALALQASSSSKNSKKCYNVRALSLTSLNYNANLTSESDCKDGINGKGKEVTCVDTGGDDWKTKFVPYDDEFCSIDHSKELNASANLGADADEAAGTPASIKQWGKDWWWKQDGSGELCSKDYVMEWIGSQICPSNPDWDDEKKTSPEKIELDSSTQLDKLEDVNDPQLQGLGFDALDKGSEKKKPKPKGRKNQRKTHRKMQEWWKDDHLAEISKKDSKLKQLKTKWKRGFKVPHFDLGRRFYFRRSNKFREPNQDACDANGEFSFRKGWRRKNNNSVGSDMWSGDLFSRELSSTTSMRGTLCYVAPEYGGCGYLMEKADIYSLGVLILVIVSGRRPLHVLASPMKLEKANLISWCRQLAQTGNILELVDERLKDEYNKEQASLCINLALSCLQKMPELRPDVVEIVKILKREMDLPPVPFEFSPSPPSKLYSRSRRKHKANAD
ncbi:hypothetical protein V6N13_011092 [Hibiscus sabdariffa]|uniref:Protein kinase domain-containing protein n=1 Tax=Hibiscus sabdariffa TaxID=183260 RepID=A0ABR2SBD7_9ROSI